VLAEVSDGGKFTYGRISVGEDHVAAAVVNHRDADHRRNPDQPPLRPDESISTFELVTQLALEADPQVSDPDGFLWLPDG
jgi:hypothetical protein